MMYDGPATSQVKNEATDSGMSDTNSNNNNNKDGFICGVVEGFYGKPWSFEQRRDLFKRLKEFKLNTFMYAPKDDVKHRAKWRQLYSPHEAQELKVLIDEAKANGIDFYYSLAPGLDIVYSNNDELAYLVQKYDQLVSLGCESFAILFDDIEPSICNERDRSVFLSYGHAQALVANVVYKHLKCPKFLFCPTEYCESRAVPDVPNSTYLGAIGDGLLSGIDIMWSGSRVISRLITAESIEQLTRVIKRPPVIWENLHANDYDKKRVFLGPYSGRSTKIIPKLRGVLTNPNCEYEANYIAIHTLAQWSKCTEDTNDHNRCHQEPRDTITTSSNVYDPEKALVIAIKDWIPCILESKTLPTFGPVLPRDDKTACDQLTKEGVEASTSSQPSEMDTTSCESCDMMQQDNDLKTQKEECSTLSTIAKESISCRDCTMPTQTSVECHAQGLNDKIKALNAANLSLLVDLFFLPFEHGSHGYTLLRDLRWLKDNSDALNSRTIGEEEEKETRMNEDGDDNMIEAKRDPNYCETDWMAKAERLSNLCASISDLVNNLIVSPLSALHHHSPFPS